MKSSIREGWLGSSFIKAVSFVIPFMFCSDALAGFYVVYSTPVVVAIAPPVVEYKTECKVVKKHTYKHKHKHYKTAKYHKKNSPIISVYYVNSNCASCTSCNPCKQALVPVTGGCGYIGYGATSATHSEYYYMKDIDEDYYSPDMDGNTLDNDIYY